LVARVAGEPTTPYVAPARRSLARSLPATADGCILRAGGRRARGACSQRSTFPEPSRDAARGTASVHGMAATVFGGGDSGPFNPPPNRCRFSGGRDAARTRPRRDQGTTRSRTGPHLPLDLRRRYRVGRHRYARSPGLRTLSGCIRRTWGWHRRIGGGSGSVTRC
jgi:hypothetical protein